MSKAWTMRFSFPTPCGKSWECLSGDSWGDFKPTGMQFREEPRTRGGVLTHVTFFPTGFGELVISWAILGLPTASSSYHSLYNLLDFPAGVVPVTTVTLQDEEELAFYKGYYGDSNDRNFKEVSPLLLTSPPGAQTSTESCLHYCGWVRAGWDGSGHSQGLAFITSAKVITCHPIPEDTPFSVQVTLCPCQGRIVYKNSGLLDTSVRKVQSRGRKGGSGQRPRGKSLL